MLPALGAVRISTVAMAVLILVTATVITRRPLVAMVAVMAWVATFETLYHVVGYLFASWPFPAGAFSWGTLAVAGWMILAWVLGIRPEWRLLLVFLGAMVVWVLTGYHSNVPGGPWSSFEEALNELAKTSLGAACLVGAIRLRQAVEP